MKSGEAILQKLGTLDASPHRSEKGQLMQWLRLGIQRDLGRRAYEVLGWE